jgi:hypothetical protein
MWAGEILSDTEKFPVYAGLSCVAQDTIDDDRDLNLSAGKTI